MLPGVLCYLLYGVAVHVARCTLLWVLLCMLPGVLCYGVAVHVALCCLVGLGLVLPCVLYQVSNKLKDPDWKKIELVYLELDL